MKCNKSTKFWANDEITMPSLLEVREPHAATTEVLCKALLSPGGSGPSIYATGCSGCPIGLSMKLQTSAEVHQPQADPTLQLLYLFSSFKLFSGSDQIWTQWTSATAQLYHISIYTYHFCTFDRFYTVCPSVRPSVRLSVTGGIKMDGVETVTQRDR